MVGMTVQSSTSTTAVFVTSNAGSVTGVGLCASQKASASAVVTSTTLHSSAPTVSFTSFPSSAFSCSFLSAFFRPMFGVPRFAESTLM